MKKIISIITIFLVLMVLTFSFPIYAATLNNIDISIDKQTVHPGEKVVINVEFGQDLGSYTIDVAYDDKLVEYVSIDGATANDTGTKVRGYYYDQTGGSSPRNNMSITFKAKDDIITSNPTNFSITLEGLANPDASISYDDITTPIIKNFVVEPMYEDYEFSLNYASDIIVNEENDMEIVVSSAMGKSYEHTRILAEVTAPENQEVKLLAIDGENLEHDIIESGWGSADGDSIGGKNVVKKLQARGIFSGVGDYTITFKLINREDSDAVIASKSFNVGVKDKDDAVVPPADNGNDDVVVPPSSEESSSSGVQKPQTLPKTGNMAYFSVITVVVILSGVYGLLRKKN